MKAKQYIKPAMGWISRKLFGTPEMVHKGTYYDHKPPKPTKSKKLQFKDPKLIYEKQRRETALRVATSSRNAEMNTLHHPSEAQVEYLGKTKELQRKVREEIRENVNEKSTFTQVSEQSTEKLTKEKTETAKNAKEENTDMINDKEFESEPPLNIELVQAKHRLDDEYDNMNMHEETVEIAELEQLLRAMYFIGSMDRAGDEIRSDLLHEGDDGSLHDEADVFFHALANMTCKIHSDQNDEEDKRPPEISKTVTKISEIGVKATSVAQNVAEVAKKVSDVVKTEPVKELEYIHGEEITEPTYDDPVLEELDEKHSNMEFVRYRSSSCSTHIKVRDAAQKVKKVMKAAGLISAAVPGLGSAIPGFGGLPKVDVSGQFGGCIEKLKSCESCKALSEKIKSLLPESIRNYLEEAATAGFGLLMKGPMTSKYVQYKCNPDLGTQVTPMYIFDPTLYNVEATQTTNDLKNHYNVKAEDKADDSRSRSRRVRRKKGRSRSQKV